MPHQGLYELREAIAGYLRGYKGLSVRAGQVVLGAGAEFLYLMLAQLFRGAALAVEDPGYPQIRRCYLGSGAECIPVALDAQGVDPAALRASGAAVLHISPAHQYPTGLVTPMPRRQELLHWAESNGGYIIEDDYDSELAFTPRPLPTLSGIDRAGRVIYMNTFSQTIAPGLRAGFLVLPERLLPLWRERLGFYSSAVPSLEQHVLARFISGGFYERHLARPAQDLPRAARRRPRRLPRERLRRAHRHTRTRRGGCTSSCAWTPPSRTRSSGRGPRRAACASPSSPTTPRGPEARRSTCWSLNYAGLGGEKLGEAVEALEGIIN